MILTKKKQNAASGLIFWSVICRKLELNCHLVTDLGQWNRYCILFMMAITKYTSFVSDRIQTLLERLFYKFGTSIFHHPIRYLISGIIITVLCALGLLNFGYENRSVFLVCFSLHFGWGMSVYTYNNCRNENNKHPTIFDILYNTPNSGYHKKVKFLETMKHS